MRNRLISKPCSTSSKPHGNRYADTAALWAAHGGIARDSLGISQGPTSALKLRALGAQHV
jgi:hypothetical protein